MSNRELVVKVKLVSDNTNPFPSPIVGTGSPQSPALGGSSGVGGNPNASGTANPLAQQAQKAAENLKTFDQHLGKAAESLNSLRESSKGMLGTLKQALFTGGGNSQASPGHLQTLMSMGGQFLGKYGMPTAVGGAAFAGAGLIMGGVNAADNFMVSRGAKPWLGHGSWDRDSSGSLYDWSPTRLMNQAEVSLIGGGKINSRGDIRTWDQIKGVEDNKFAEAMRRTTMQAPIAEIEAQHRSRMSDVRMQYGNAQNRYLGYKDYAVDADIARDKYMNNFNPLLDNSRASLINLHGKGIGSMIADQERMAIGDQSTAYGQQMAEARAAAQTNRLDRFNAQSELDAAKKTLHGIEANKAPGDKGVEKDDEAKAKKEVERLQQNMNSLLEKDLQIRERIKSLTLDQVRAQKDVVSSQLSNVMQSKMQEAQTLQGQKEAFGMMDAGDQQYFKDVASRFKDGGIKAITQDERSMLLNSPLGEDVRIQARKVAEDSGFADIYRGSRAEARATELEGRQGQLEKLKLDITRNITVNAQSDKTELAKEIVTVLGKYYSDLIVTMETVVASQKKQVDNQAQLAGQQRSAGSP